MLAKWKIRSLYHCTVGMHGESENQGMIPKVISEQVLLEDFPHPYICQRKHLFVATCIWVRPYHFNFFKGCLSQILLRPFLNTLTHISVVVNFAIVEEFFSTMPVSSDKAKTKYLKKYMFKVNYRNTRTMYEVCSKLPIKTLKWHHRYSVLSVLLTLNNFDSLLYSFHGWR